MNPVIEKVEKAIREAAVQRKNWGPFEPEDWRLMAEAAIESLGLTEMVESIPGSS